MTKETDPVQPGPEGETRSGHKKATWIILVLCLAIFGVRATTSMVQESSTYDETHYFGLGKYLLQTGRWDVPGSILHPPLSYYLHSIPLLFFSTDDALWQHDPARQRDPHYRAILDIQRGQALLSSPANDGDRLLTLSRCMMVLVAILLGWYVFSWSFALYGNSGAIIAIVLYSFCPNILAHARLITPDIVVTAFFFATVYYFWKMLRENRLSIAVMAGVALGLALLAKYTAVLLIPLCLVLALLWLFQTKSLPWRGCLVFGAVGLAVLLLGYRGNLEPYFAGIQFQREFASKPQWVFICGDCLPTRWGAYFYTVAFLLKTPIAAIIGLVLAVCVFAKKAIQGQWISEVFLLVPALTIFAFFSINAQCLGLRYLLPMYPFLFVFIAGGISRLLSNKTAAVLCGGLAIWYLGASLYIHPHYLAYFNELAGGPDNGYKCLVDSSLDWGQDLKGLGRYMREHNIPKIRLSYSGSDSPERYGIAFESLPGNVPKEPPHGREKLAVPDYVAISATNLQGVYLKDQDTYAVLRSREPIAKIGYSILIYDNNGTVFDDSGHLDQAIARYRKALEIRPDFADAHTNLGLALAKQGRLNDAVAEYRKALELKPNEVTTRNNLGVALRQQGRLDEAVAVYQEALEIQPQSAELHDNLGNALSIEGRFDEAAAEFHKALEINPQYADAYGDFGTALCHQGRAADAVGQYHKALELNPDSAKMHNNLANAWATLGRLDDAVAEYRKALEIQPDYGDALNNLGAVLYEHGRTDEAMAQWDALLRLQPNNAAVLSQIAWALATNPASSVRNGARAVELAQRAARLTGGHDPGSLDALAAAYAEAGRFAEAVQTAQQALDLMAGQADAAAADALRARIKLYQAGLPYRDVPPPSQPEAEHP